MNILALDCSSKKLSYSIVKNDGLIYQYDRVVDRGASFFIVKLEKTLKNLSMQIRDFDLFAIGSGPGSFTGLRVSFSIVKAFALAAKKPVFWQNSFFACAYPFWRKEGKVAVVADAKKNLVYAGFFVSSKRGLRQKSGPKLMKLKDCLEKGKDYLFITYDSHLRKEAKAIKKDIRFYQKNIYPRAKYFIDNNNFDRMSYDLKKLKPLYLHSMDCQVRKGR
ncbi:MAG: tRNA (adenosine(37)-N6)-threonylcarbamoyltransferase complex dimerization subunit type 1 TsaB [Candidatus Omnitrophica bacterium]|nr:tRNA (adenosine(37)-N6)-threonylcarbamoyltransferase complex dimerization subunit type 1 TsaB [Candidatus Omnitrophota bacterium]MCF7876757.1 tRNA (adenosine(37)-N6)-threonylcarbamoyltransferase complex dimerization subunit type 1 TsaB [Candidatus Omnitrophota bacterium]MCF7878203.1 tRNA (adenosine(37)-N6)-threonylcarbamoyltransferase complex dimerization subunit type 1 TsaB [Candidatus Omnitrophota bacterium]MCF7892673.1 tRNA (adenosine(37)-N6)-threonylcarbamoyltransferase complex dimerizati